MTKIEEYLDQLQKEDKALYEKLLPFGVRQQTKTEQIEEWKTLSKKGFDALQVLVYAFKLYQDKESLFEISEVLKSMEKIDPLLLDSTLSFCRNLAMNEFDLLSERIKSNNS